MDIESLYKFCMSLKGVTEHLPFDKDTLVFKANGKMFILTSLKGWEVGSPSVNLKCNPELALELRAKYEAVLPGYHMNKTHWNTIKFVEDMPEEEIMEQITNSYKLIYKSKK